MDIFYDQKLPNYLPKGVCRTPPENAFMNVYFYFYCVVKCGNHALGINEWIKKIFSDTRTNPNPPLSQSDRGPSSGAHTKRILKESPLGPIKVCHANPRRNNYQNIMTKCPFWNVHI
jgi:hypothetical protein